MRVARVGWGWLTAVACSWFPPSSYLCVAMMELFADVEMDRTLYREYNLMDAPSIKGVIEEVLDKIPLVNQSASSVYAELMALGGQIVSIVGGVLLGCY